MIKAGTEFLVYPQWDREIVTWVLDGEGEHDNSAATRGIIYPGLAQRGSAGTGFWHSKMKPWQDADLYLVQMWGLCR